MVLYQNNLSNPRYIQSYISVRFDDNITISNCETQYCYIDTSKSKFQGMAPLFYVESDNSTLLDNVTLNTPDNATVGCKSFKGNDQYCPGNITDKDGYTKTNKMEAKTYYDPTQKVFTIEMPYIESVPKGRRELISNKDNKTMGKFNFEYSYPYDNTTGKFLGLTPAMKFVVDNNTLIEVDVKFYDIDNNTMNENMVFNLLNTKEGDNGFNFSWKPLNSQTTNNFTLDRVIDNGTVFKFKPEDQPSTIDSIDYFIFGYHIGDEKFQIFVYPQSEGCCAGGGAF